MGHEICIDILTKIAILTYKSQNKCWFIQLEGMHVLHFETISSINNYEPN
jgi:hypothetical protein